MSFVCKYFVNFSCRNATSWWFPTYSSSWHNATWDATQYGHASCTRYSCITGWRRRAPTGTTALPSCRNESPGNAANAHASVRTSRNGASPTRSAWIYSTKSTTSTRHASSSTHGCTSQRTVWSPNGYVCEEVPCCDFKQKQNRCNLLLSNNSSPLLQVHQCIQA